MVLFLCLFVGVDNVTCTFVIRTHMHICTYVRRYVCMFVMDGCVCVRVGVGGCASLLLILFTGVGLCSFWSFVLFGFLLLFCLFICLLLSILCGVFWCFLGVFCFCYCFCCYCFVFVFVLFVCLFWFVCFGLFVFEVVFFFFSFFYFWGDFLVYVFKNKKMWRYFVSVL